MGGLQPITNGKLTRSVNHRRHRSPVTRYRSGPSTGSLDWNRHRRGHSGSGVPCCNRGITLCQAVYKLSARWCYERWNASHAARSDGFSLLTVSDGQSACQRIAMLARCWRDVSAMHMHHPSIAFCAMHMHRPEEVCWCPPAQIFPSL